MAEESTKEELYNRAQELDIQGRSSMTKEELQEAIEEAEGPRKDETPAAPVEAGAKQLSEEEAAEQRRRAAVVAEHEEHNRRMRKES